MNLRYLVRQAIKAGTAEYANVESIALGTATVRLVGNGTRLTNLPYFGDIAVGDKVVVNRTTDAPYVYAFVGTEELDTGEEEAPTRSETFNPFLGVNAGRIWYSQDYEVDLRRRYTSAEVSTKTIYQPFDTTVYNTAGLKIEGHGNYKYSPYQPVYGPLLKIAGTYFIRATICVKTDEPYEWRWHDKMFIYSYEQSSYGGGWTDAYYTNVPHRSIRNYCPLSKTTTYTISTLVRWRADVIPYIYIVNRSAHNTYSTWGRTQYNYWKSLSVEGQYPILEWALVAEQGDKETATPFWWNDWI